VGDVTPPPLDQDELAAHVALRRRKRGRMSRRRSRRSFWASVVLAFALIIGGAVSAATVTAGIYIYSQVHGLDIKKLKPDYPGQNTIIYDRYGGKLATVASVENRTHVTSSQISPWLKEATVAIEDRRFYEHGGVDYVGVLRAMLDNINAGHVVQGASTIEQQLVRQLYLNDSQTLSRKVKEAYLADQLANQWSRDQILSTYIDVVQYGAVTYGCEAAAEAFFGTHCKNLNIRQSALIAGLPQSPTNYNPTAYPAAALVRRNEVLTAMQSIGYISTAQLQRAVGRKRGCSAGLSGAPVTVNSRAAKRCLRLHPSYPYGEVKQPYFVQYVKHLITKRYGAAALATGGLHVDTTIDPKLQAAAQQAFHAYLDRPGLPAAALVSIDPRTGEILAFDASTNYRKTKFDLPAQARRQAGSSFKPYGLAAAMVDLGIDPETTEYSSQAPFHYPIPGCVGAPSCIWTVNNAESNLAGNFNLHVAMDGSINAVFARLSADIGPTRTVNMAYNVGIPRSDHLPKVYSIILGTGLVSPLDMASAYSTFAANGIHHNPLAITDVTAPTGATIASTPASKNPGRRALPSWAASEMNKILYDNIYVCPSGLCTGSAAALSPYRPAAGKTGTVEAHLDAWFCGYTPNLTTCVWMGFPQGEISMIPAVGSADSFGGGYPALIWHSFMTAALAAQPAKFPATSFPVVPAPLGAYRPFTSQFQLYTAPTPPRSTGGGKHNTGNGNGNGNGSGNGNGNGNGGGKPPH
jgi:penicillin-binding protein 1A